jgi:hypothetical protein
MMGCEAVYLITLENQEKINESIHYSPFIKTKEFQANLTTMTIFYHMTLKKPISENFFNVGDACEERYILRSANVPYKTSSFIEISIPQTPPQSLL